MRSEFGEILADVRDVGDHALAAELAHYLQPYTDDELEVLGYVAARLDLGRTRYGPLRVSGDARDWQRERMEEMADALVYAACKEIAATLAEDPPSAPLIEFPRGGGR